MRIATLHCHDAAGSWTETYREGESRNGFPLGADVETWAKGLIDQFNATLRRGEIPRVLDRVEITEDIHDVPETHTWTKTNAITQYHPDAGGHHGTGAGTMMSCRRSRLAALVFIVVAQKDAKTAKENESAASFALFPLRTSAELLLDLIRHTFARA